MAKASKVASGTTGAVTDTASSSVTKALKGSSDYVVPVAAGVAGFGATSLLASKADESGSSSDGSTASPTSGLLSSTNLLVSSISSSSCMLAIGWVVFLVMGK